MYPGKDCYQGVHTPKKTINGLAAGGSVLFRFNSFKITKALKGKGVFIVAHVDRSGKITEQNESNNQVGFALTNASLDAALNC